MKVSTILSIAGVIALFATGVNAADPSVKLEGARPSGPNATMNVDPGTQGTARMHIDQPSK
jgi:hypothetical protein